MSVENKDMFSPDYYRMGSIECIDYINDHNFNFNLGNVIKYVTRAGHKKGEGNTALNDLRKAQKYLEFEISRLESEDQ